MTGPEAITLAMTAEMFAFRPSAAIREPDPVVALDFDQALAVRLSALRDQARREAKAGKPGMLPPGMRYETDADIFDRVH